MMTKFSKLNLILITVLLINTGIAKAATTVTSEGVAAITSTMSDTIYQKRAIENALQNIAISRGQALTSFTIIENGQILFDQIQSTSKAGILSYQILSEHKKNKQYFVKIKAVIEDHHNSTQNTQLSTSCRHTEFPAVDLTLKIKIDPQQFPPWTGLGGNWIFNELSQKKFKPVIIFRSNRYKKNNSNNQYDLFTSSNTKKSSENIHHINLQLDFTKYQKESFFVKNQIMRLVANSEVTRNGTLIANRSKKYEFVTKKKFGVGLPVASNKKLWKDEKQRLIKSIVELINDNLDLIGCATINAKLKEINNSYYIDYGSFDGITPSDIFVLESSDSKKFYFSVEEVRNTTTNLKLISNIKKIELNDGHSVRLVEEL